MAHILHIDTSARTGLVMLATNGKPVITRENLTEKDHAATINGMIDAVLAEADISLIDIDAIAVCTGPGSYTGLRIGMATAKGICYALDKPMVCNNKLELLVGDKSTEDRDSWISLLPARDGEYFFLKKDINEINSEPVHLMVQEVNEQLSAIGRETKIFGQCGQDIIKQKNLIFIDTAEINTILWAKLAYASCIAKTFVNIASVEPLYLKSVFINKKS